MPSHNIASTNLVKMTPGQMVEMSGNELIEYWEKELDLHVWHMIGQNLKKIARDPDIKLLDKHKAMLATGELALRMKKSNAPSERGGAVQIAIMTNDPTQ
jgi:hypothetical protein